VKRRRRLRHSLLGCAVVNVSSRPRVVAPAVVAPALVAPALVAPVVVAPVVVAPVVVAPVVVAPLVHRLAPLLAVALLAATPAWAARGRGAEALDVVVLPFAALSSRAAQTEAKESLELELELVDNARVQSSEALEQDLEALGEDAFAPRSLSGVLKRRGIEVLVAAPAGLGRPTVVAFAADGQPRVVKELPRGAAADQLAATTMAALKPALGKWAKLKPLPLPATGGGRGRGAVDDDDVLAEADRPRRAPREDDDGAAPRLPRGGRDARGRDPGDNGEATPTPRKSGRDDSGRSRRRGDDGDAEEKPASRALEEASPRERRALDGDDDNALGERQRRSPSALDDESIDGAVGQVKSGHLIAVSGAFDGATWRYDFTSNAVAPLPVVANFYPGGSLRFDLWPFEFIGVDATVAFAAVRFQIRPSGAAGVENAVTVSPESFGSLHLNLGGAVRGRYLVRFADDGPLRMVGLGGRLGYRSWSASIETQVIQGTQTKLTIVPGFQFRGLAVGPELYLPIFVANRRFEFELKTEAMPLTFYGETPDNPGASSVAFGAHGELLARFDVLSGVFVEVAGKGTAAVITFEGQGDRVTTIAGSAEPVVLQGGNARNYALGFSVGLGFLY